MIVMAMMAPAMMRVRRRAVDGCCSMTILRLRLEKDHAAPAAQQIPCVAGGLQGRAGGGRRPGTTPVRATPPHRMRLPPKPSGEAGARVSKKNRRSASAGTQPSQRSARLMCASSWQIAMRCCRSSSRANRCAGSSTTGRSRPATSGVSTSSDSRTSRAPRRRRRRAPRSRVRSRVSASAGVEFAMTLRVSRTCFTARTVAASRPIALRRRQHAGPGHRDPDAQPMCVHGVTAVATAMLSPADVLCGAAGGRAASDWNAGRRRDRQHDRRDPDEGDHELGAGRPPDEVACARRGQAAARG